MEGLERITLILALVGVIAALATSIIEFTGKRKNNRTGRPAENKADRKAVNIPPLNPVTGIMGIVPLLFITVTIISRIILTGHGPFSNMFEFAIAFAWGIMLAGAIFRWRFRTSSIMNIGLIVALLLLIFAAAELFTGKAAVSPLVPALQQSALLSAHVASAVVAYGTLTIGFGAAILLLIQHRKNTTWLPDKETLDIISYRAVIIGFPFLTLLIVLGAFWANIAWGKYWSWDPKETASLVTWLIYAAYMHTRIMRGWRDTRSALLLIIGFAAILMTFFGNYVFTGLHAYGR